jgi:EAL domain-containing protein (putative c-di-GMP-specific phosphodiesterase class I)/DNA-binding response OmpR family regulator
MRRPPDPTAALPKHHRTVLVVDDDPVMRGLVALALRRAGLEAIEVSTGPEALDVIDTSSIDVVVSDVGMPGMSGTDLVRVIRERPRTGTMPVILMTGSGDDQSVILALEAGADDFLPKPVRLDELVARVRSQLRSNFARAAELQDELRSRSGVVSSLGDLTVTSDPEEAATRIVEALSRRIDASFVAVSRITAGGTMVELASFSRVAGLRRGGDTFSAELAGYLIGRAKDGPWVDDFHGVGMAQDRASLREASPDLLASAPLFGAGSMVGLLSIGVALGSGSVSDQRRRLLSAAIDYATVFDAVAGVSIVDREVLEADRVRLAGVLAAHETRIVVQPIIELDTGAIVGYEALTRFADGTRPDIRFAEAAAVGLGSEFELASVALALEVTGALPAERFLTLNASPATIIERSEEIAALLAGIGRQIVIEVTEHVRIDDYDELRAAVRRIGEGVSLAVDDAGAGYASLRHIIELEPGFAKLDISLVRGIDADRIRQALAAGLNYFALRTDFRLIAEGVETEAEAETLRGLGIEFAQGYHFGRPVPVDEVE